MAAEPYNPWPVSGTPMDQSQTDFTAARNFMVDCQIRPNRVTDPRVLDAMRSLPREQFVPPAVAAMAYIDEDLPLGGGRVLMEPMVIARLLQAARIRPGDKALVVASGTGYGAAIAEACGATVTALEEDESLMAIALRVLPRHAPGVSLVDGRIATGLPAGGPWNVILIEGAVAEIPAAYAGQLAPGGRLVTVIAAPGSVSGRVVLAEPVMVAGVAQRQASSFNALDLKPAYS
jgi:protein-L-isoaspartate(D-aspartate) O-methyltransferase